MKVDLPHPDGPMMAVTRLSWQSMVTFFRARDGSVIEIEVPGFDLGLARFGAHLCFLLSRYRRTTAVMFMPRTRTIRTRAVP